MPRRCKPNYQILVCTLGVLCMWFFQIVHVHVHEQSNKVELIHSSACCLGADPFFIPWMLLSSYIHVHSSSSSFGTAKKPKQQLSVVTFEKWQWSNRSVTLTWLICVCGCFVVWYLRNSFIIYTCTCSTWTAERETTATTVEAGHFFTLLFRQSTVPHSLLCDHYVTDFWICPLYTLLILCMYVSYVWYIYIIYEL